MFFFFERCFDGDGGEDGFCWGGKGGWEMGVGVSSGGSGGFMGVFYWFVRMGLVGVVDGGWLRRGGMGRVGRMSVRIAVCACV